MRDSNPAVIPRNHRVEAALEAAVEQEDYQRDGTAFKSPIESLCTYCGAG